MRKQGPCFHCGATETPLWRNGPTEKPVLCNACGSRWRLRRSLANYVPKHSYALRKKRSLTNHKDFCYYGSAVKVEEDDGSYSDYNLTPDEFGAGQSNKVSSESVSSDQLPTVKSEPIDENENSGAGIQGTCINQAPSESGHSSHIEDLRQDLYKLYVNRRFLSSYEPKDSILIYHNAHGAPSVGRESTLGVVLLEAPKQAEKKVSERLPLLLEADFSILEAPKGGNAPSTSNA